MGRPRKKPDTEALDGAPSKAAKAAKDMTLSGAATPAVLRGLAGITQALELRKSGMSVAAISERMGIDDPTVVASMIHTGIRTWANSMAETADEVRQLELHRMDEMLVSLWDEKQNPKVSDTILKIMDRRAKLIGLDAPAQIAVDVTGLEGLSDAELKRRVAALQQNVGLVEGTCRPSTPEESKEAVHAEVTVLK